MMKNIAIAAGAAALLLGLAACRETTTTEAPTTTYWAPEIGTSTNDESLDDLAFISSTPTRPRRPSPSCRWRI